MGKIKKRPTNIRTVGDEVDGKYSVSDVWPPRSFSGKYLLPSRTLTRVDEGEVYMNEYIPGKTPTTTIHRVGNMFAQDPDTVYAVGSIYGAKTSSFSNVLIDPVFIPKGYDEEQ